MEEIRIKRKIVSENLRLPELKQWIGKDVEIIFLVEKEDSPPNKADSAKSKGDWRDKMTIRPRLLVPPEEIIHPIKDIWEGYLR